MAIVHSGNLYTIGKYKCFVRIEHGTHDNLVHYRWQDDRIPHWSIRWIYEHILYRREQRLNYCAHSYTRVK